MIKSTSIVLTHFFKFNKLTISCKKKLAVWGLITGNWKGENSSYKMFKLTEIIWSWTVKKKIMRNVYIAIF